MATIDQDTSPGWRKKTLWVAVTLAGVLAIPGIDPPLSLCTCTPLPCARIRDLHRIPDPHREGEYVLQEYNVLMNDHVSVFWHPDDGTLRKIAKSPHDHDTFVRSMTVSPSPQGVTIYWGRGQPTFVSAATLDSYPIHPVSFVDSVLVLAFGIVLCVAKPRKKLEPEIIW